MVQLKFLLIFIFTVAFALTGCQEELEEFTEPQEDQVLTTNSPVANLVQRIALLDGSSDNIIDNSSCISIVLPVTVIVNSREITVGSEKDFNTIEKIFDESDLDEDDLEIIFPVKVILSDYSELLINNEEDLEDLIEECTEGGDDEDIECVDFQYPLQFSVYDSKNQISRVISVNNDKELYTFFNQLDNGIYVSFNFPVTLTLADGAEILVNDNDELEDIIEDSMDDCDEDDDNDFDEDDVDDSELKAFLTTGKWKITSYTDGDNNSDAFEGIEFSFNENGYILASEGIETVEGEWETYGDSGKLEVEFDFESVEPYKNLNEEWQVIKYTNTRIELEDTSGGADFTVVFEKI